MSRRRYWLAVVVVGVAATWLNWPTMHVGYTLDDYAQLAMLEGIYPARRAPWDLYTFSSGAPSEVDALVDAGFYPWWSHPEVRLSMFRPLASLLLLLDHELFGYNPLAQHLHSLAHWIVMLVAIALLFERTLPRAVALTATLLLTLDPGHAVTLGWIANRTAITSAALSTIALIFYLDVQSADPQQATRARAIACACYCTALLAGEYGLSFLGFFIAFEWLGSGDPPAQRLARLAWVGVPALGFMALRMLVGGGGRHSEVYLDPFNSTELFAGALMQRLPVLIADAFFSLRADYWSFGAPFVQPAYEAGWVDQSWVLSPGPWRRIHVAIGWVSVVAVGFLVAFVARRAPAQNTGNVVWLCVGGLLCTLPLPGSLPTSRLLLTPMIGVSALLATLLHERIARLQIRPLPFRSRLLATLTVGIVLALHGVLAPIQARAEGQLMALLASGVRRAILEAPLAVAGSPEQRAIVLATGDPTLMIYIGLIRRLHGKPAPRSTQALSGNRLPFALTRADDRTLLLRYVPGASSLVEPFELMFRPREPMRVGQRFELSDMTAEIREVTADGRPAAVRFRFAQPLEHSTLSFWFPTRHGLRPFPLPAVGQTIHVPPTAMPLPK